MLQPEEDLLSTKLNWQIDFVDLFSIPTVEAKIELSKLIQPIFSVVAREITGRLKLELGAFDIYRVAEVENEQLGIAFQSAYLYRQRVKVPSDIPMGRIRN